jgi:transcriptional regulator with XRE-family HTH domain
MEVIYNVMYRRIRDLRTDHDMTQKELSKILGMSQTGYSKYETGENDIPTEILIRLSKIYNVSIDYLLDQTDCKKPYK